MKLVRTRRIQHTYRPEYKNVVIPTSLHPLCICFWANKSHFSFRSSQKKFLLLIGFFALFLLREQFANNPSAASIYCKQYGLITDSRANQGAPSLCKCKWRLGACRDWLQGESSLTLVSLLCQTNTCCSAHTKSHMHINREWQKCT